MYKEARTVGISPKNMAWLRKWNPAIPLAEQNPAQSAIDAAFRNVMTTKQSFVV